LFKKWFIAARPWSFTAALAPVFLGTAIAHIHGRFNGCFFLLTCIAAVCVQAGTNFINTYADYVNGVDTPQTAADRSFVVRGELSAAHVRLAGFLSLAVASLIGLVLTYYCGWPVLAFGLVGVIGGYTYTAGVKPYKYMGLGTPFVFLLMGPLMVWPAYFIQTGDLSWTPIWASLPVACLVAAILHANDLRDLHADQDAGAKSFSIMIGAGASIRLYYALIVGACVFTAALVILGVTPWASLLPLVLIPSVIKICAQARDGVSGDTPKINSLEAATGQLHFQYGVLFAAGVALAPILTRLHF
jgi:1,4-dihydroxy-2-naphthoate octaprenyltransferase